MSEPRTRILLAKPGLDVHDRGIRVIARACRDAGMEVVYLARGLLTVPHCIETAVQEDVDVVGLSVMTGKPEDICSEALSELRRRGANDVALVVGGVIRKEKRGELEQLGVAAAFTAGTPLDDIIHSINALAAERRRAAHSAEVSS